MALSQENLSTLDFYLQKALSPDQPTRIKAEEYLKTLEGQPGYPQLLLKYSELENNYDIQVRILASICFKNYISKYWIPKRGTLNLPGKAPVTISPEDRAQVKHILPDLMLVVNPKIGKQLLNALTVISDAEWPNQWKELLPGLISKLDPGNFDLVNTILKCINSCLKRYRSVSTTDEVILELLYILGEFQEPMLQIFNFTCKSITEQKGNESALKVLFTSVRILINIFYTLNYIELPEYFEDHMGEYMTGFRSFLVYETTSELLNGDDDERPGLIHKVQAGVFDCISLYVEKYEEDIKSYLEIFATDTFNVLSRDLTMKKYDNLVTSAIKLLTSISRGTLHGLFEGESILNSLCKEIIVKNTILGEADIEQFEDDPAAFIQRDVEGSDQNTRRRSSAELIKGLRKNYEERVTGIIGGYITEMIAQYKADNSNWLVKDAAIYLITAVASEGETQRDGIKSTNQSVPMGSFYQNEIVPELQKEVGNCPILIAACLKFVNRFRTILGADSLTMLFPLFIKHLGSPAEVTKSYAATCIEKILTIRDEVSEGHYVQRYQKADLSPYLGLSVNALFTCLNSAPDQTSLENHYIMRAILRIITLSKEESFQFYPDCLSTFANILTQIYTSPTNSQFAHYLFEAVACIIRNINQTNPKNISIVEDAIFSVFTGILQQNAETLHHYIFQIFGLLIESEGANLSLYQNLFPAFLNLELWSSTDSVPSLARIIEAYITRMPNIIQPDQLEQVILIFSVLVENRHTDHLGFEILTSLIHNYDVKLYESHLPNIFSMTFSRLSTSKTNILIKSFIVFLAHFIIKYDVAYVFSAVDSIQENISDMVINNLWIEYVLSVDTYLERKVLAIAMVKIFLDYPKYITENYQSIWINGVQKLIELLENEKSEAPQEEPEYEDHNPGQKLTFSPLSFAKKQSFDPLPNVDVKAYFAENLKALMVKAPMVNQYISKLSQPHLAVINPILQG